MKEKVLQEWIEQLVSDGSLFETIEERDRADPSTYFQNNEKFIPSFPIDFLMRQRSLAATEHVLGRLQIPELISTASANISLNRSERLFPDLLLCDPESGSLVLVEIKRSKSTEREAITQLMAYEHEIRNHYPFLSNLDICHVVIAMDYSPLLDHSIAGLVTWNEKQVLCLRASGTEGNIRLEVHIPEAWTSIGQKPIPSEALVTTDLYLYQKDTGNILPTEDIERIADTALNLIARDGDRYNSHGFVMLWEDLLNKKDSPTNYCLTIGMINPYPFTDAAVASDFLREDHTALVKYIHSQLIKSNICPRDSLLGTVCRQAKGVLEEKLNLTWETFSTWGEQRSPILDPAALMQGFHYRALPLKFEFWGVLGSFARQFVTMPAVRKYFDKRISAKNVDWRDPSTAIEILDRLVGIESIQQGRFTCSSLFKVGDQIASFLSINHTMQLRAQSGEDLMNLPAMQIWYGSILTSSLREVMLRYGAMLENLSPPPSIERSAEYGYAEPDTIEAMIRWILDEFLRDSPVHQRCFVAGMRVHGLLNPYFSSSIDEATKQNSTKEITEFGRFILTSTVNFYNKEARLGNEIEEFKDMLEIRVGLTVINGSFAIEDCEKVSSAKIISLLLTDIIDLADKISFPLYHSLEAIETLNVDWTWLKQQAVEMRERNCKHPGLIILGDGGFGVHDSGIVGASFQYDLESQIPFTVVAGGSVPITVVVKWEDLENGILPSEAMDNR